MKKIYLDHAAATPVDARVKTIMDKYFNEYFGNPSSITEVGLNAKKAIEESREVIAQIINALPEEIIFTSSGTESINLAIQGIAKALKHKGNHVITSKIEHNLEPDKYGQVQPEQVEQAIKHNTILASIMYANNEIGTINNISKIGEIARKQEVYFHTDACQAANYLDLDVKKLNADLLTLNASKIYGPKGAGLLFVKKNTKIKPLIYGGGQENGLRSGTENVPAIVGFASALMLVAKNRSQEFERLLNLKNMFIKELKKTPDTIINGHLIESLPNNISATFKGIEADAIIFHLNEQGIFASTGSACTTKSLEPSHVITGIGIPAQHANGTVRFTLGRETTKKDIDYVVKIINQVVDKLRAVSPVQFEQKLIV
ncbi:cysteine desulfurase [Candidatus Woesearchaeota archaeon]|nr:cysteine desulfurase [Candidatus Woesearchaeota archaeon]